MSIIKYVRNTKFGKVVIFTKINDKKTIYYAGDMYGKIVAEADSESSLMEKL